MVISESIVSIIFRAINTLMVAVCAVYIFNKYVLTRIKTAMDKKEQELIALRLQDTQLGLEIKKLEQQIKKEEEYALCMQERIILWREKVDIAHKAQAADHEALRTAIKTRYAIKNAYISAMTLERQVVPHAIDNAQEVLKKHFESLPAAQHYIANIITFMHMDKQ